MVVYTLLRAPGVTTNPLVSQRRKKRQGRVLQMSKQFVKQFQLRRPFHLAVPSPSFSTWELS